MTVLPRATMVMEVWQKDAVLFVLWYCCHFVFVVVVLEQNLSFFLRYVQALFRAYYRLSCGLDDSV